MNAESYDVSRMIIVMTIIAAFLVSFIAFIIIRYSRSQQLLEEKIKNMNLEFDKTLLTTQVEMQEKAFEDISLEIHDHIGHSLSLAKFQLNTIPWHDVESAKLQVEGSVENLTIVLEDLRDLTNTMNAEFIRQNGLLASMKREMQKVEKLNKFKPFYNIKGTPVGLDSQKELVIFRMIQEGLTNIIKHANASIIDLLFHYGENEMEIRLTDNGKGFEPVHYITGRTSGAGLKNIEKRAALINGYCKVISAPGKGTQLYINIPYQNE